MRGNAAMLPRLCENPNLVSGFRDQLGFRVGSCSISQFSSRCAGSSRTNQP